MSDAIEPISLSSLSQSGFTPYPLVGVGNNPFVWNKTATASVSLEATSTPPASEAQSETTPLPSKADILKQIEAGNDDYFMRVMQNLMGGANNALWRMDYASAQNLFQQFFYYQQYYNQFQPVQARSWRVLGGFYDALRNYQWTLNELGRVKESQELLNKVLAMQLEPFETAADRTHEPHMQAIADYIEMMQRRGELPSEAFPRRPVESDTLTKLAKWMVSVNERPTAIELLALSEIQQKQRLFQTEQYGQRVFKEAFPDKSRPTGMFTPPVELYPVYKRNLAARDLDPTQMIQPVSAVSAVYFHDILPHQPGNKPKKTKKNSTPSNK